MAKGEIIWLKDYELVQAKKEVKRPGALRSVSVIEIINQVFDYLLTLETRKVVLKNILSF